MAGAAPFRRATGLVFFGEESGEFFGGRCHHGESAVELLRESELEGIAHGVYVRREGIHCGHRWRERDRVRAGELEAHLSLGCGGGWNPADAGGSRLLPSSFARPGRTKVRRKLKLAPPKPT